MKKPLVIGSIVLGVFVVVGVSILVRNTLMKKSLISKTPQTVVVPAIEQALWEDQAGFSFQYPKEVRINKHDEDVENYAQIEMTSATHSGRLIVWAKDTTYADVDTWVVKDKTLIGGSIIDTTLGEKKAKKIVMTKPVKKLITGSIDEQILFTIEAEPFEGDVFWTDVYNTIAQSFIFTTTPSDVTVTDQSDMGESASYDEEEVLE